MTKAGYAQFLSALTVGMNLLHLLRLPLLRAGISGWPSYFPQWFPTPFQVVLSIPLLALILLFLAIACHRRSASAGKSSFLMVMMASLFTASTLAVDFALLPGWLRVLFPAFTG